MKPQDLRDWATTVHLSGKDAHLGDVLDDCAKAWEEDQERIAELENKMDFLADYEIDQLQRFSMGERDLLVAADALEQAADRLELAIDSGSCRALLFDYADRLRYKVEEEQ